MNIFPISKIYDGARYECKDYFTTMEFLKNLGLDERIGDQIDIFLWDYVNPDTRMFNVKTFSCVDDLRALRGEGSMFSEFFGAKGLPTYKKYEVNGKEFMLDTKTGKTHKVIKKSHLKLVK